MRVGLEVTADKTKYMVMSRDHNAERSQRRKFDNSSFARVEKFKYLGTTLTNKNFIQEEIKSRLNSGNACYHSAQNLLSSSDMPFTRTFTDTALSEQSRGAAWHV